MAKILDKSWSGDQYALTDSEYSPEVLPAGVVLWPKELPCSTPSGYGFEKVDGRRITEMDQGPPRVRLVYKNTPQLADMAFLMTEEQYQLYERFYREDAKNGSMVVRIPALNGEGISYWDVRFLKKSKTAIDGLNYRFSISVVSV